MDSTRDVSTDRLVAAAYLTLSSDPKVLARCNVYIVTVPTPIDSFKRPDLHPLEAASRIIGVHLRKAAGTKWNCLLFRPRLVGGHCIGVDPYYLTHKVQHVGYYPEVILAGRRINDGKGAHVAERVVKLMTRKGLHFDNATILVLGLGFKESCPDLRNTGLADIITELKGYNVHIDVHDPWVSETEAFDDYGLTLIDRPEEGHCDAII